MRSDKDRLSDILEAIREIGKYASRGKAAFERDELIQVWVLHHLRLIGEASRSLSKDFQSQHRDIPWSDIIGMRHILVHDYFRVDPDLVWAAVENDLPALETQVLGRRNL